MLWSRRVRSLMVVAAALVGVAAHASTAYAAEWLPPVEGGSMILGFGAAYPGGSHRGVDIAAAPGVTVSAPVAGTVSFAGRVPADGGGTCVAVTLELADGRRMSLLPLESADVVSGECVESGQTLGVLAASGDDSSSATHLHMSLRRGELYLDPGDLVSGTVAVTAEQPPTPACPPGALSDDTGGEPSVAPVSVANVASCASMAPADPVQCGTAVPSVAAGSVAAIPRAASRPEIEEAGAPQASALMPSGWRGTTRDVPVLAPIDLRIATGAGLACAMIATAAGIVLSHRAQPVRID